MRRHGSGRNYSPLIYHGFGVVTVADLLICVRHPYSVKRDSICRIETTNNYIINQLYIMTMKRNKGTRKGKALRTIHIENHLFRYCKRIDETIVYALDGRMWFRLAGVYWKPSELKKMVLERMDDECGI